jgi:hypothetical protein
MEYKMNDDKNNGTLTITDGVVFKELGENLNGQRLKFAGEKLVETNETELSTPSITMGTNLKSLTINILESSSIKFAGDIGDAYLEQRKQPTGETPSFDDHDNQ